MRSLLPMVLLVALCACSKSSGPKRCYGDLDCSGARVCVQLASSARTCVDRCDAATDLVCDDGEACVPVDGETDGGAVCLPGGETILGDRCGVSSECVRGALCVARNGSLESRCEALCSLTDPEACGETGSCDPVDVDASSTRGTCVTF